MKGYISSLQSLGTVDGPGVRAVVFGVGCPLRCAYCHNPETWLERGEETDSKGLAARIMRFKPYIKEGGVTFSGGEPLLQAEFFTELAGLLKEGGLHIALDTSGCVTGESADNLISAVDLVILDIKFTTEEDYKKYTGGSLSQVMDFLGRVAALGKNVWVRQVIVGGINDGDDNLIRLKKLLTPYSDTVERVEFLPFRKLCLEKYERLGLVFPFSDCAETPPSVTENLNKKYDMLDIMENY